MRIRSHSLLLARRDRRQRNRRFWQLGGSAVVVLFLLLIYFLFFHVSRIGPRAVVVNGDNVDTLAGYRLRRTVWLSKNDVQSLFSRLRGVRIVMPNDTHSFRGNPYVRANDVVHAIAQAGAQGDFAQGHLIMTLGGSQHYVYTVAGDQVRQQGIVSSGHKIRYVLAVTHKETLYLPAAELASTLSNAGMSGEWTGQALQVALKGTVQSEPLQKPSDYIPIQFGNGKTVYSPKYVWNGQSYIAAYSVQAALAGTGWTLSLNPWTLSMTPSQTSRRSPVVLAFVPYYYGDLAAFNDVMNHPAAYSALADDVWTVDASGSLSGAAPAGSAAQAVANGDAAYAMVSNLGSNGANASEMTSILGDASAMSRLESSIVNLTLTEDYDGVTLDFESMSTSDRSHYTAFVTDLANKLHAAGKLLQVVVPPDTGEGNEPWNGAYDQSKLGAAADRIIVMAYDYSYPGSAPGPVAPLPWVQEALAYTTAHVPASKVLLGLDAYGYDWSGKHTTAVGLPNVDAFLAKRHIQPQWDATNQAPWFQWTDSQGAKHTVYYENAKSTTAKLKLAATYGIAGVAVWRAGLEDDGFLRVLKNFKAGQVH